MKIKKNITYLFYCNVSSLDWKEAYNYLPTFRQQKIDSYKIENDKILSAGAWIILHKAFSLSGLKIEKYEFKTTANGKPYFEDCPIEISYSHSGDYVLVALSGGPVGVDIEKIRDVDFKIMPLIYDESQIYEVESAFDKQDKFFEIWTSKEANGKKSGLGIQKETPSHGAIQIEAIEGYKIGLAHENKKVIVKNIKYSTINLMKEFK